MRNGFFLISIHALLAESDQQKSGDRKAYVDFYPRSPCGERPQCRTLASGIYDFYPRSPCGERRVHYDNYNLHCVISIHALLAESDSAPSITPTASRNFYPRSPCGERLRGWTLNINGAIFLSTLSLRRATSANKNLTQVHRNFYPRSPCGERHRSNGNSSDT